MTQLTAGRARSRESLKEDLCARGLELAETHISWVFLGERDVWKVKKPVELGFLDFSTPEKRRRACEAEVRLNRRLAPRVYRGVVPVTRDRSGRHRLGGEGQGVDWAVHMVRLPDADRADRRLEAETLGKGEMRRIAERLAAFHDGARCDEETARYGTVEAIGRNVRENFEQTRRSVAEYLSRSEAAEIEARQLGFLQENGPRFEARIRAGRVRDGHGDLRLDHLYLDAPPGGGVAIIDCIEFNERFRYADVCADVAFLAMDLTWHGRADLAELFLAAYARSANDYDLYPLVDFYESYRAYVRAKVASMLAQDPGAAMEVRERAAREARRFYLLALASERRSPLPPAIIAVGGIIASGKSAVAERVAAELGAPVVDTDRTRKFMLGVEAREKVHVPAFEGPYGPEWNARVYAEALRRAEAVVESGRPVVLDASFRSRETRAAARRLAARRGVPFQFVECRADRDTCLARLDRRAREEGVSDGRREIFNAFLSRWEPVAELSDGEHLELDTREPLEANLEALRRRLPTWPAGLTR